MTLADGPPPARRIGLRLAYEGTCYSGWQTQPGRTTVQGVVTEAIRTISGEEVLVRGASRTDAGVHALDQVAAFTTSSDLPADAWVRALNARLPSDVTVVAGRAVAADFDPVAAAVRKRYRYRIHDAPWRPVLQRHLVWRWRGRLDEPLMQAAAGQLVGEHDFTSFESTPSTRLSKIRTIHALTVRRTVAAAGPGPRSGSKSKATDFCTTWCGSSPARSRWSGRGAGSRSGSARRSRPGAGPPPDRPHPRRV